MEPLHADRTEDDQSLVERIVRGAIRAYRLHPFADVDDRAVAEVSGVPIDDVRRLFPTWEALLLVAYERWAELRVSRRKTPPSCTIDRLRRTLAEDVADPGFIRVSIGVVNFAGSDSPFADVFQRHFEEYAEQLAAGLQNDFDRSVEQSMVPAHQAATQLLAVYQGLQIQMLVRPHIDVLVEYDRAVRTLRQGWRKREVPSWDRDEVVLTS